MFFFLPKYFQKSSKLNFEASYFVETCRSRFIFGIDNLASTISSGLMKAWEGGLAGRFYMTAAGPRARCALSWAKNPPSSADYSFFIYIFGFSLFFSSS